MPAFSYVFANLIDDLAGPPELVASNINRLSITMIVFGLSAWALAAVGVVCFSVSGQRQVAVMKRQFFRSILRQEVAMFDLTKAGDLSNRMNSDVNIIALALGSKLANLIQGLATFLLSYIFAFWQSWRLTLCLLGAVPFIAICGAVTGKLLADVTTTAQNEYAHAGGIAQEVLSSIRTVQAFSGMGRECERYAESVGRVQKFGLKKSLYMGLSIGMTYMVMFASYALAFWYGSYLIEWGYQSGGKIVGVFFAVLIGAFQLGIVGPIFSTIAEAQGAARKVFEILDRVPAMNTDIHGGGKRLDSLECRIEFNDVAFTYPSRTDVPIFDKLNLSILPGQTVALVGPSGSGKSSIVSLLMRFYDVGSGSITVDGVPITELDLHWWRSQVGIVTQEPTLFSATVFENIQCAHPEATRADVIKACKDALIHDVISKLPNGYDTHVGEGGSQLSGGQKQRVAIARAIIKNPKMLLLDEATSALDRHSEILVQKALENVMKGRTVITIAHRLVTIQKADTICFIQPRDAAADPSSPEFFSRLLESGTHDELMMKKGEYSLMVQAQHQSASTEPSLPEEKDVEEEETVILHDPLAARKKSVQGRKASVDKKEGSKDEEQNIKKGGAMMRTMKLNASEWPLLLFGLLGAAIAGTSYPLYSIIFAEVIGVFFKPIDVMRDEVGLWCLMFVALGVGNMISLLMKLFCLNYAGEILTGRLRTMLFHKLVHMDIGFFDKPGNESGALCARLSADTTNIQHIWGGSLGTNAQGLVCLLGGLVIAFIVSWKLTLVTAATIPVMIISSFVQNKFMWTAIEEGSKELDAAGQVAAESISGCRTVFAFNLQDSQVARYDTFLNGPLQQALKKAVIGGFFFGLSQFVIFGSFALSYWYGGQLVSQGEMGMSEVLKCSLAVLMGAMGVGEVYSMAGDQVEGYAASTRVYTILDTEPAIDSNSTKGSVVEKCTGLLKYEDLMFNYPSRPDVPILKHLDLDISPGQRVAILGQTGCGKSTLISLLMRYYDPLSGRVLADNEALSEMNVQKWRQHLGIVSQEPILFDTTVAANIKYGKPDATESEVHEAAKKAQIHDLIMSLPDGYETNVGAKGSQLSGGQKQRVAIARCIIRQPTILLLDEATSALDNVSEKEVQTALDAIIASEKLTVLTVAHRLSTIKNCNMIIFMEDGKILEKGTHDELYALKGEYRRRYDQYYDIKSS
uniref:Bile salt export pump n=1 Tax=Eutreptiella gymnastica TaxID=73025 RepID=A0A7S1NMY1_9EUGL